VFSAHVPYFKNIDRSNMSIGPSSRTIPVLKALSKLRTFPDDWYEYIYEYLDINLVSVLTVTNSNMSAVQTSEVGATLIPLNLKNSVG
jgi:hypothetical protein